MPLMLEPDMSPVPIHSDTSQYCKVLMHYVKVCFHQVNEAFYDSPTEG